MGGDLIKAILFCAGIALVLFALYHSWRADYKSNLSIILLLAGALFLRISTSLDPFLHKWDERYHALVARNLSHDFLTPRLYPKALLAYDYQSWVDNFIWLHKPPLPLWTMALSIKYLGANELSVRLPSILLSTLAVYFTWLIGLWLFSARAGFIAAFFHAVNGLVIEMTGGRVATDHIDVFFLVFVELGVLCAVIHWKKSQETEKYHLLLLLATGASVGLALLCKWLPALIVLPVFVLLHWRNKSKWLPAGIILVTAVTMILPWQVYASMTFPKEYWYEMQYNSRHITESLGEKAYPWYFHFDMARIIWNELVYLPMLWLAYRITIKKEQSFLVLGTWIFLPYIFFSMAATKMPGYVLFTCPAIFILEAVFIIHITGTGRFRNLSLILCYLFFLLALRYCVERAKPFTSSLEMKNTSMQVKNLANQFDNSNKNVVLFNNTYTIETMFYTDLLSYERLPKEDEVEYLLQNHYRVILFDGERVPGHLRSLKGVEVHPNPF